MKFSIDGKEIFSLSETQKKVLKHVLHTESFDEDIARRVRYIIESKYKSCMQQLKASWIPKLKGNNVNSIPLDDEKLAELIFEQPGYENRSTREKFNEVKNAPLK